MPVRIKNTSAISLPITIECNGVSSSLTILSRQTITLKPGFVLSARSKSQYPQLKVIDVPDAPESVPPPAETIIEDKLSVIVSSEKKPSATLTTKVVDKNPETGGNI